MALQPGDVSGGELSTLSDSDSLAAGTSKVAGSSAIMSCECEAGARVSSDGICERDASQQVVVVGTFDCSRVACDFGQHPCWLAEDRGSMQANRGVAVTRVIVNRRPRPAICLRRAILEDCLTAPTASRGRMTSAFLAGVRSIHAAYAGSGFASVTVVTWGRWPLVFSSLAKTKSGAPAPSPSPHRILETFDL